MKNLISILVLIGLTWFISSCQSEEGCLNPKAVNYDPSADTDCCCDLTTLNVRLYPMRDTFTMDFDQQLTDAGGNSFFVQDFKFYNSQLTLTNTAGKRTTVRDTTTFQLKNNSFLDTVDRYLLFDESIFEYQSGIFDDLASFDSLELDLGLNNLAQQIKLDMLDEDHPLKNSEMYDDIDDSLVSLRVRVSVNNSTFSEIYKVNVLQKVTIPYTITPEIAFNTWVELDIDYQILFQNINFTSDSENTIENKLVTNLTQAIRQH